MEPLGSNVDTSLFQSLQKNYTHFLIKEQIKMCGKEDEVLAIQTKLPVNSSILLFPL